MDREKLAEKIAFLTELRKLENTALEIGLKKLTKEYKDNPKAEMCELCCQEVNSEYHINDVCVRPLEEDPLAMR